MTLSNVRTNTINFSDSVHAISTQSRQTEVVQKINFIVVLKKFNSIYVLLLIGTVVCNIHRMNKEDCVITCAICSEVGFKCSWSWPVRTIVCGRPVVEQ